MRLFFLATVAWVLFKTSSFTQVDSQATLAISDWNTYDVVVLAEGIVVRASASQSVDLGFIP